MEKKGHLAAKSLIFCTFVLLFMLSFSSTIFADACYDPAVKSCQDLDAATCRVIAGSVFYQGQTVDQVSACQLGGCCCYTQGNANQSIAVATQASCFQLSSKATYLQLANLGTDPNAVKTVCSDACKQARAALTSGVTPNATNNNINITTTTTTDSGTSTTQTTQVTVSTLDDCQATIIGQVVSPTYGLPNGLLVFATSDRTTSWGVVQDTGAFVITGVCSGTNVVTASDASGQFTSDAKSVAGIASTQTISDVTLTLTPTRLGVIKGTVVDADSITTKLSGIFVRVKGTPYASTTDANGAFAITIPNVGPDGASLFTVLASSAASATTQYVTNSKAIYLYDPLRTNTSITIGLSKQSCTGSQAPTGLSLMHTQGSPNITLSWQLSACQNLVQSYSIYRCKGQYIASECSAPNAYFAPIDSYITTTTYVDNTAEWDTNYTYRVGAVYAGPVEALSTLTSESDVNTGNAVCAGIVSTNQFCGTQKQATSSTLIDAIQFCNSANLFTSTLCTAAAPICVVRHADIVTLTASCVAPSICAQSVSNNPFGMYYSSNSCSIQGGGNLCYLDKGTSNVDACQNCKQGMTCSDYKSKTACTSDASSCNVGGCSWQSIDDVLGIGVCKSSKLSSCGDCMNATKSPFGVCDATTCAALGSSDNGCFYKSTTTTSTCQACSATTCGEYTTVQACQGGNPGSSTSLNSATNAFLSNSGDQCNMGVCRWVIDNGHPSGGCVKDADADVSDDCFGAYMDPVKCNLDRTPPTTYVIMPTTSNPFYNNVTIRFLPQDKGVSGSIQVYSTKFCITDKPDSECLNAATDFAVAQRLGTSGLYLNLTGGVINLPADEQNGLPTYHYAFNSDGGVYYLKYYSTDNAKNLEVVKTKQFVINTTPPEFNFTVSQLVAVGQSAKTNVIATVNSVVPLRCLMQTFPLGAATNQPAIFDAATPKDYDTFHESVFLLNDGPYDIKATCRDVNGNANVNIVSIVANADSRIQNIQPSGLIATPNPIVTLQTTSPVVCKMTSDQSKLNLASGSGHTFADLDYTFASDGVRQPSGLYNYTYTFTNLAQGNHTYYIACDFNPYGFDTASFVVDTQPPLIRFETSIAGTPFDFSAWQQSPVLYAVCYKPSGSRVPCTQIEYCKAPVSFGSTFVNACNISKYTQLVSSDTRRQISIDDANDYSVVVCARARETVGLTQRVGEANCQNLLIDKVNPLFTSNDLKSVTNKNQIALGGFVFDPVAVSKSVTFPQTTGISTTTFYADKLIATNLVINGSFNLVSSLSQRSYAQITLRNGSVAPVIVQIDMRVPDKPTLSIVDVAQQTLGPIQLPSADLQSGVTTVWSIFLNGSSINVTIGGTSLSGQVATAGATSATGNLVGPVVFTAYNLDNGYNNRPQIAIDKISYVDLDLAALYPPSIYIRINGGQDSFSSTSLVPTIGKFSQDVLLSNSDKLVEGRQYQLSVFVRDQANRDSAIKTSVIQFSSLGPDVTNVTFVPENKSQTDISYIEYRQNATANIFATTPYGIARATVRVLTSEQELTTLQNFGIAGRFSTQSLPTGYLDVVANVTDNAGSSTIKTIARGLWIRNLLDPTHNISVPDQVISNNTPPTFTFNVNDTTDTNCSATYTTATGVTQIDSFTPSAGNNLSVTLSQPLPYAPGDIVESQVTISCHSNVHPNDTWSHLVRVLVDLRSPVIAVMSPAIDRVILTSQDRTVKNYLSYVAGLRTITVLSDKSGVVCRINTVGSTTQPADPAAYYASLGTYAYASAWTSTSADNFKSTSTQIQTFDNTIVTLGISCADTVGNVVQTPRFVTITTNSSAAPFITSVTPTVITDPVKLFTPTTFTVTTAIPAESCTLQQQGKLPDVMSLVSASAADGSSTRSYVSQVQFTKDAANTFTVACAANGATSTKTVSVLVDTQTPTVTVAPTLANIVYTATPFVALSLNASESVIATLTSTTSSDVLFAADVVSGMSTLNVPVPVGVTDAQLTFADLAGNSVSYPLQIRRAANGYVSQFIDLLPNSIRPTLQSFAGTNVSLALLTYANASSVSTSIPLASSAIVTASLSRLSSTSFAALTVPVTAVVTSTSTGAILNFSLPTQLVDGTYVLSYIVTANNTAVAADSAVFTIDSLSELITPTSNFSTTRRALLPILVNISIPYLNLPIADFSSWNGHDPLLAREFNNAVTTLGPVPSSLSTTRLNYSIINELGHKSQISAKLTHDVTAPFSPVIFTLNTRNIAATGNVPTSGSPVPLFTLTYAQEPMRIVSANIVSGTGSQLTLASPVFFVTAQDNQFYNELQVRSASSLRDGQYSLLITIADQFGNYVYDQKFDFKVQATALKISLFAPKYGLTSTDTLPFTIQTDRPAICAYDLLMTPPKQYADMKSFTATDGFYHSASLSFDPTIDKYNATYAVTCLENGTLSPFISTTFMLGKDKTKPAITSITIPTLSHGVLSNTNFADLVIATSTPAVCRYTTSTVGASSYNLMTPFDNSAALTFVNKQSLTDLNDKQQYTITAICDNGAGVLSDPATIAFTVDTSQRSAIVINSPSDGNNYVAPAIPIQFTVVNPVAQGCYYATSLSGIENAPIRITAAPTNGGLNYSFAVNPTPFKFGNNELYIRCIFADSNGNSQIETAISRFVVDNTKPDKGVVVVSNVTTRRNRINAEFMFKDNESGIAGYQYAVGTAPYGSSGWNTTRGVSYVSTSSIDFSYTIDGLNLTNGATYYVSALAKNGAGLSSDWVSSNATVVNTAGDNSDELAIENLTTITLLSGSSITYASTNGSTSILPDNTKLKIPSSIANLFVPGASITMPAFTVLIYADGKQESVPKRAVIKIPSIVAVTNVAPPLKSTVNQSVAGSKNNGDVTGGNGGIKVKNTTTTKTTTNNAANSFGAGLLLFLLALGIVGSGVGYFMYARSRQSREQNRSTASSYATNSSANDDVIVPRGPLTVNDKLKLALQARIRKQKGTELPGKTSKLFSAFDADATAPNLFTPRIGVTKIDRSDLSSQASSQKVQPKATLADVKSKLESLTTPATNLHLSAGIGSKSEIDATLQRTQLSLNKLKILATNQKPVSQLRRSSSKSSTFSPGSALTKLKSLSKK